MLVVGAARGAEPGEQPAFDRRDVGGVETQGGAEIVVRLRTSCRRDDARLGEPIAVAIRLLVFRHQLGRRLRELDPGLIEGSQIVIDGDRTPEKQHFQPDGAGQRAMCRGLVWCDGHGLPQDSNGVVVLMLVDQLRGPNAQRISGLRLWRRRGGTRPQEERHARGQWPAR